MENRRIRSNHWRRGGRLLLRGSSEQAGYHVYADHAERAASPLLMLSDQTQLLLRDVFESQDMFRGATKITKRVVAWGASSEVVVLPHINQRDSCFVESTTSGWLFLLPSGERNGSLISVGDSADTLLGESRLVANQFANWRSATGRFPAYPRIVTPLAGSGWIACGSEAVAFDPIAGEGTGNAVREGILARR